ncbi:sigma 54 modulation protein [Thermosporothrix hazakensis]|jgi:transcriptional regulator with AAA-type ATPase domain/mannose/fructose-specific phosphotransferase system component IIA|uniref:Sigma 54 modulation protein n=1 Tax=Thermosporothrix hazakensis TaxID=644383 RepID=A0A326UCI6_THEHA|nr:sigma-54-dependent transcriptional regulator [Thermosporothrix hazakensis]PZW36036.1 sigma 54 modulation protein [Thermosporothrix hazakensis]GCE46688.1 transcriptional antiterminator [Thermosporothrix hazakensis]
MLRKEKVLEALRYLCTQQMPQHSVLRRHAGFSAEEVALQAGIDRSNASRDLNQLAHEGMILRIPGRPVLFTLKTETSTPQAVPPEGTPPTIVASVQVGAVITSFDTLIGNSEGLKSAIQQAKAAILYPPHGLHTLLCGPSGVGKTTVARLMHDFAIEQGAFPEDAPFVSFNCADYAGNPQLLMAHLFGVVRGAYTGADRDRSGLVEQAHRGILFLDEVHRLPPEGQEMLFYLMDKERFRRLGEVKERSASVLLIAATTEDPHTTLLPTFRRRIPMVIRLPGLNERPIMERYELVRAFFTAECSSIGVNIQVTPQAIQAFLLYNCPGNIGQLRTDVQLTCAQAYLEYRTHNRHELSVHIDTLPDHVRNGLLHIAKLHQTLEKETHYHLKANHIFTPTGLNLDSDIDSGRSLYDIINTELAFLRKTNLSEAEIHSLVRLSIQQYFQHFAQSIDQETNEATASLVDKRLLKLAQTIVHHAETQLGRTFPEKLPLVLALHLSSAIERSSQGHPLHVPGIQAVRQTYPIEYEIARFALQHIQTEMGVTLPESEANVLVVLFNHADTLLSNGHVSAGIVIAAHGHGVAQGLAELANTLVGATSVSPVELDLEQTPEEILNLVEQCVRDADQGSGVLLLVDFASLLSLGEIIAHRTGIAIRAIANISAPLVIEASRKAQRAEGYTLDELATSLASNTRAYAPPSKTTQTGGHLLREQTTPYTPTSTKRVILSICLTGYGSATKLAEVITERLPEICEQDVEIICMDISITGKTEDELQRLVSSRQVVAVVGTINPHLKNYPFISLSELLFGDGITRLRTLLGGTFIDPALLNPPTRRLRPRQAQRAALMREIEHTLRQRSLFLNPARVLPLIERTIEMIEIEVGESFDTEVLAGLILHLATLLERSPSHPPMLVSDAIREQIHQLYPRELAICRHAWQALSLQIGHPLPEEEAYNIVSILRQVDIFIDPPATP